MKKFMLQLMSIITVTAIAVSSSVFGASATNHADYDTPDYIGGCLPTNSETDRDHMLPLPKTRSTVNLPSSCDLSSSFPPPGNQGIQGSCTAWAVGYALKSYQEHIDHNWNAISSDKQFSPAYIYNQLSNDNKEGIGIGAAMNLIVSQRVCTLADMPYNPNSCAAKPTQVQRNKAAQFKAARYNTIYTLSEMKEYLAVKREGIVISIPSSFPDFKNLSPSNPVYDVVGTITNETKYHAICLVGYDDSKQAFKFINSYGGNWGINGYGYVSYDVWENYSGVGYVMQDEITQVGDFVCNTVSGDFNGDGKTDVAKLVDLKTWNIQLQVQLSNGSQFNDFNVWAEENGFSSNKIANRITSGDYNGDGKDDIALMYRYDPLNGHNRIGIFVFLSTGNSFVQSRWFYDDWYTADNVYGFTSGDFNGDGKDDISALYDNGISDGKSRMTLHVFPSNGSSFTSRSHWLFDDWYTASKTNGFSAGDFNGDGKDDIAVMYDVGHASGSAYTNLYVYQSNGSAFTGRQTWSNNKDYYAPHVNGRMAAGDFNGDGKDDVVAMYDNGSSGDIKLMTTHLFVSQRSSFSNYQVWYRDYNNSFTCNFVKALLPGDFNGDGKLDISVLYEHNVTFMRYLTFAGTNSSFNNFVSWCDKVKVTR